MPGWHISSGGGGGAAGIGGSTGATDDAILIADGTGGATAAASAATLTAAGSLTIPSAETIEIGTDVGLARVSANLFKITDGGAGLGGLIVKDDFGATKCAINFGGIAATDGGLLWASSKLQVLNGSRAAYRPIEASAFSASGTAQYQAGVIYDAAGTSLYTFRALKTVTASTAGSGAPKVLAWYEVGGNAWTNEGAGAAAYFTLPTAIAGYHLSFIVQDADGMRIVASASDTIRVIDKVTAAAGYIESTTIGSTVTLVSVNAVEWYAIAIKGVWTDGTFTYDDTSLTTP